MTAESQTSLQVVHDDRLADRRLNALLVGYHYFPENNGGVQRLAAMKKYLPRFGVEVSLLTHRGTIKAPRSENSDGVVRAFDITRHGMPLPVFLAYRLLQRVTRYLGATGARYALWRRNAIRHAERLVRAQRPDVIVATYPPTETIVVALTICRRFDIPLVVDFREIFSLPIDYLKDHAVRLGPRWRLKSPFLEHFSQAFARFFMRVGLPSSIPEFR